MTLLLNEHIVLYYIVFFHRFHEQMQQQYEGELKHVSEMLGGMQQMSEEITFFKAQIEEYIERNKLSEAKFIEDTRKNANALKRLNGFENGLKRTMHYLTAYDGLDVSTIEDYCRERKSLDEERNAKKHLEKRVKWFTTSIQAAQKERAKKLEEGNKNANPAESEHDVLTGDTIEEAERDEVNNTESDADYHSNQLEESFISTRPNKGSIGSNARHSKDVDERVINTRAKIDTERAENVVTKDTNNTDQKLRPSDGCKISR